MTDTMLTRMARAAYLKVREIRSGWVAGSEELREYEETFGYKLDEWPDTGMSISSDQFIEAAKAALQAVIDHGKGLSFLTVVDASSMPVGNAEQMINSFLKAEIERKA